MPATVLATIPSNCGCTAKGLASLEIAEVPPMRLSHSLTPRTVPVVVCGGKTVGANVGVKTAWSCVVSPGKKNMSDHHSSWKHWSMLTVCIGSGIEICCRRCWYICGCGLANNFRCRGSCCRGVDRCGSGSGRDSLSIGMLCKHWENKSRRTC